MAGHDRGRSRSRSRERRDHRDDSKERRRRHDTDDRHGRSRSPPLKHRGEHRSTSRSPSRKHKRRHSRSRSRSVASSNSSRRHRGDKGKEKERHRHKRRHRSRSRSRSRSRDSSRERDRKKKKKHKKSKKDKDKAGNAVTEQWGKHGIISEADIFSKEQEFDLWLVEVKLMNPESMPKPTRKKLFQSYMEDYNTATLPHEKFYALEAYERRMTAIRSGETLPPTDDSYDAVKDMEAHKSRLRKAEQPAETHLSREELQELRRVQNERAQIGKMKALGLEIKNSFGVRMDGSEFE